MGYIQELRKLVGTRPLVMVGAAACVFDSQGRILLLRRVDNGGWGLPGGALEPGETTEGTARRETHEETGLKIAELTLHGVFSGPELYYRYPNGDEVHNVVVVYRAQYIGGPIRLDPAEHHEYGFYDLTSLPTEVSPPCRPILRELAGVQPR